MAQPLNWTNAVHHDGSEYYVSNPLPQEGEIVEIKLRTPTHAPVRHVYVRSMPDGEAHMEKMRVVKQSESTIWWSGEIKISMSRTDYHFKIMTDEGAYYYNALGISRAASPEWFDFTILANYDAPTWVCGTVFYQIFPDRFHNGNSANDILEGAWTQDNFQTQMREWDEEPIAWKEGGCLDFFGGDLDGITQKLNYLQELGINAIYLTPIFEARSNHRYDIIDYFKVDPHVGGDEALTSLRQAMNERGMRLMLDITPNHLGVQHKWFVEAVQNPESVSASYFRIDQETGEYETWLGVPTLIKLDYTSQKLRDVMYRNPDSAIRHWMHEPYAIDAWRLDVANMTGNLGYDQLDHEVWREMRTSVKQDNPELYLMGEYFHDGTPHLQGNELDASMNYQGFNIPVRRWLGGNDLGVDDKEVHGDATLMPTDAMTLQWKRYLAAIPFVIAQQQFNQLSSHDITRILTVVQGDKKLAQLGHAMLLTFIGVPCLYYGDEIGMEGGKDPFNRRTMIWDETRWDREIRDTIQRLVSLRRSSHALQHGGFQILHADDHLIVYQRESSQQRIIFIGYRGQTTTSKTIIPVWHGDISNGTKLYDVFQDKIHIVRDGELSLEQLEHGEFLILETRS